jgi:hypothetical protein
LHGCVDESEWAMDRYESMMIDWISQPLGGAVELTNEEVNKATIYWLMGGIWHAAYTYSKNTCLSNLGWVGGDVIKLLVI